MQSIDDCKSATEPPWSSPGASPQLSAARSFTFRRARGRLRAFDIAPTQTHSAQTFNVGRQSNALLDCRGKQAFNHIQRLPRRLSTYAKADVANTLPKRREQRSTTRHLRCVFVASHRYPCRYDCRCAVSSDISPAHRPPREGHLVRRSFSSLRVRARHRRSTAFAAASA